MSNIPLFCPNCGKEIECFQKPYMMDLDCPDCYNYKLDQTCIKDNHSDLDHKERCECTIHDLRMLAIELRIQNDIFIEQMKKERITND
jgi:hypothetical protein